MKEQGWKCQHLQREKAGGEVYCKVFIFVESGGYLKPPSHCSSDTSRHFQQQSIFLLRLLKTMSNSKTVNVRTFAKANSTPRDTFFTRSSRPTTVPNPASFFIPGLYVAAEDVEKTTRLTVNTFIVSPSAEALQSAATDPESGDIDLNSVLRHWASGEGEMDMAGVNALLAHYPAPNGSGEGTWGGITTSMKLTEEQIAADPDRANPLLGEIGMLWRRGLADIGLDTAVDEQRGNTAGTVLARAGVSEILRAATMCDWDSGVLTIAILCSTPLPDLRDVSSAGSITLGSRASDSDRYPGPDLVAMVDANAAKHRLHPAKWQTVTAQKSEPTEFTMDRHSQDAFHAMTSETVTRGEDLETADGTPVYLSGFWRAGTGLRSRPTTKPTKQRKTKKNKGRKPASGAATGSAQSQEGQKAIDLAEIQGMKAAYAKERTAMEKKMAEEKQKVEDAARRTASSAAAVNPLTKAGYGGWTTWEATTTIDSAAKGASSAPHPARIFLPILRKVESGEVEICLKRSVQPGESHFFPSIPGDASHAQEWGRGGDNRTAKRLTVGKTVTSGMTGTWKAAGGSGPPLPLSVDPVGPETGQASSKRLTIVRVPDADHGSQTFVAPIFEPSGSPLVMAEGYEWVTREVAEGRNDGLIAGVLRGVSECMSAAEKDGRLRME